MIFLQLSRGRKVCYSNGHMRYFRRQENGEKTVIQVHMQKLNEFAVIPKRGSASAAGYDLTAAFAEEEMTLAPGESRLVGTGLAVAIPEGYFGGVFARSGLSLREGLRPANCVGVIDADYRGELKVPLHNDSTETRIVKRGERIAQLVILPFLAVDFEEAPLSETERGSGGFGSTGKGGGTLE